MATTVGFPVAIPPEGNLYPCATDRSRSNPEHHPGRRDVPGRSTPTRSNNTRGQGEPDPLDKAVNFSGRWSAEGTNLQPCSTVRRCGSSARARATAASSPPWGNRTSRKRLRLQDPKGRVGGIKWSSSPARAVRGEVKIVGRKGWPFAVNGPQSVVTVTLTSGTAKWCAEPPARSTNNVVKAKAKTAPTTCPCETYATTWAAIEGAVLRGSGCTDSAATRPPRPVGGLDLTPANAYHNLVGVSSAYGVKRVEPFAAQETPVAEAGRRAERIDLGRKGSPMPNGLPPSRRTNCRRSDCESSTVLPRTASCPIPKACSDVPACAEPSPTYPSYRPPPSKACSSRAALGHPARKQGENARTRSLLDELQSGGPGSGRIRVDCPAGGLDGPTNPSKKCFLLNQQLLRQSANDPPQHHPHLHGDYPANDPGGNTSAPAAAAGRHGP